MTDEQLENLIDDYAYELVGMNHEDNPGDTVEKIKMKLRSLVMKVFVHYDNTDNQD